MAKQSIHDIQEMRIRTLTMHSAIAPENLQFVNNHQKWTSSLIWAVLVVTFSTSFVMGVNNGGPNQYNSFIIPWARGYPFPCQKADGVAQWVATVWWGCNYTATSYFNKTGYYYLPRIPVDKQVVQSIIDSMHSICLVIGGTIGGLTGQYWYLLFTRRNAICVSMVFQVVASILMVIPLEIYNGYKKGDPDRNEINYALENKDIAVAILYISRFLSGWSSGLCCVVSTIYLMDISPRPMRGKVVTFHQLFVVIGLLMGQIVGLPWLLGQHDKWNWGMSWIGLFSFAGCFLLWTLPESPRWLVQERQRTEAAASLRILRQVNLIDAELDEIEREEATVARQNISIYEMFILDRYRWPLLTSIALNAIQQLSGINTVFFYSNETLSDIGFVDDKVYWGVLSTGIINLIMTAAAVKFVEIFGRRPLILYPLIIITIVMMLLCFSIQYHIPILSLVLILIFIAVSAVGLGPIPYIYPNEVFTIDMRPAALSISIFASWLCNTIINLLFPLLKSVLAGYTFLIFCLFCTTAFVLLWFKMPETKRKKLSEIEAYWGYIN
ncbi:unnamed protein product [Adineta ricciae]|uniref:Major facilitator superfamily (MFS) profile domain-containing protein n=1 Tax=Adineta ricciae TaxID=249248 RepID=A0A815KGH3_ADIRI|nr:unnamed protein product [Adineta ricciae]CAF1454096.1 unnamed protein product [Adineta ricciae]